jgi:hypothetical protein
MSPADDVLVLDRIGDHLGVFLLVEVQDTGGDVNEVLGIVRRGDRNPAEIPGPVTSACVSAIPALSE